MTQSRTTVELPVPVRVDDDGRWSVDDIEMVLVPRHLIVNNLGAAETTLGTAGAADLVRDAGYRSARTWCQRQSRFHRLDPVEVVRHYLDQLSRRGWGRFHAEELDIAGGTARVTVHRSALAERTPPGPDGACYLFSAWLEGALDHASDGTGVRGRFTVEETGCAGAEPGRCTFLGSLHPS